MPTFNIHCHRVFVILDPDKVDRDGWAQTVAAVSVVFSRPRNQIPTGQYNEAIERILSDAEQREVLKTIRNVVSYDSFCAKCGGGINVTACRKCGKKFKDDWIASGTGFDLPTQARQWLETKKVSSSKSK